MITSRNERQVQYRGLFADIESLDKNKIANGTVFTDIATGDKYMFDEEAKIWHKIVSNGGSSTSKFYDEIGPTTSAVINNAMAYPIINFKAIGATSQADVPTPTSPQNLESPSTVSLTLTQGLNSNNLSFEKTLRSINVADTQISDEIYIKDGKLWYQQKLFYGRTPSAGIPTLVTYATGESNYMVDIYSQASSTFNAPIDTKISNEYKIMCTHFAQSSKVGYCVKTRGVGDLRIRFVLPADTPYNTEELWKKFLSENEVYVLYPLRDLPEPEEITDTATVNAVKNFATFYGVQSFNANTPTSLTYAAR